MSAHIRAARPGQPVRLSAILAVLLLAPATRADFAVNLGLSVLGTSSYRSSSGSDTVSANYNGSGLPQSYDFVSQAASDGFRAELRGTATATFASAHDVTIQEGYRWLFGNAPGLLSGMTRAVFTWSVTPDVDSTLFYDLSASGDHLDLGGPIILEGSGQQLAPGGVDYMGFGSAPLQAGHSYQVTIPISGSGIASQGIPEGEFDASGFFHFQVVPATPEPATAVLFGVGVALLAACRGRLGKGPGL